MPGRPHLERLSRIIEDQGGDDVIFDRIASGETIKSIVEDYENPDTGKPYTRGMIYTWIHAGGEEREQKWREAKAIAAHSLVEDAGDMLEDGGKTIVTSAQASILKERASHKRWLAGMYNREDYGEKPAAGGQVVNIENLHLSALMQHGTKPALESGEEPEEADYELVE